MASCNDILQPSHSYLFTKAKSKVVGELDKAVGSLLYHLATRFKGQPDRTSTILDYVCARKISSEQQLTGARATHECDCLCIAYVHMVCVHVACVDV